MAITLTSKEKRTKKEIWSALCMARKKYKGGRCFRGGGRAHRIVWMAAGITTWRDARDYLFALGDRLSRIKCRCVG